MSKKYLNNSFQVYNKYEHSLLCSWQPLIHTFYHFFRYGQIDGYIGDPYLSFEGMLIFSNEEITSGIFSSMIVFIPLVLLISLFRKSLPFSKKPSRFDKVIEESARENKIQLPESSFKRNINIEE